MSPTPAESSARLGNPIVVSAPSGAGKTSVCRELMQRLGDVAFSISHTTRPPRGSERDGVDYHFVDDAGFDQLVAKQAFLEWAPVHGRRYGTSRTATEAQLRAGQDVLFDIDVQGGEQLARALPQAALVLLLPPSLSVLAQRLRQRHVDSEEQIALRLKAAAKEIDAARFYTHVIVNHDLQAAVDQLAAIILAERARMRHGAQAIERALHG